MADILFGNRRIDLARFERAAIADDSFEAKKVEILPQKKKTTTCCVSR